MARFRGKQTDDRRSDDMDAISPLTDQRRRGEAAGLGRLRPPQRQPESGLTPAAQSRIPFRAVVRDLTEAHPWLSESRSRVPCFLTHLFFSSWWWDTPFLRVGHPPRGRQEAARDRVAIDTTRAP